MGNVLETNSAEATGLPGDAGVRGWAFFVILLFVMLAFPTSGMPHLYEHTTPYGMKSSLQNPPSQGSLRSLSRATGKANSDSIILLLLHYVPETAEYCHSWHDTCTHVYIHLQ
jgi:hypothetical protein